MDPYWQVVDRPSSLRSGARMIAGVLSCGLVACSGISNLVPADGSTVPVGPVTMSGEFRSNVNQSLRILLDGNDVTAQFNPVYASAPGTFRATMGLAPGAHTLLATGVFTEYVLFFPSGQRTMSQQTTFTVPGPTLSLTPASGNLTVGATTPVTVTLSQAQGAPVSVQLASTPGGVISLPATTTVAQGSTQSPAVAVGGVAAGTANLSATSAGFTSAQSAWSVAPGLSAVAPVSGPVGTSLTLTGSGFSAGASVQVGGVAATGVSVLSPTTLTAVVPAGLAVGNRSVTATVNGVRSAGVNFAVVAAPPVPPAAVLFRTSAQDVQTFTFFPAGGGTPAQFALVDTDAATAQGGVFTVGIAQTPTRVLRSSPADVQAFIVGTPLALSAGALAGGAGSGTGSGAALTGSTAIRAIDSGIEVRVLNAAGTAFGAPVFVGGSASATGVAVDALGSLVVRAHAGGIELFDVSNPAAPVRLSPIGAGGGDLSAVGTGVRFVSALRVVRSIPNGIEEYDITNPAAPTRLTVNRRGFVDSAMGTALAVESGGTAAIRATSMGLERYPLPLAANAAPAASTGGRVSTTGVGVAVVGPRAFRATNDRLEAYDLPALGNPVADTGATVSAVGVGLAARP